MKRLFLIGLALVLALALLGGCQWRPAEDEPQEPVGNQQPADTQEPELTLAELTFKSYAEVYAALYGGQQGETGAVRGGATDMAVMEEAAVDAETPMDAAPMATPSAATDSGKGAADEASGTNVQVEGVDEGDIVKNDGDYIYILRGNKLLIVSAKGADSAELSATELYTQEEEQPWKDQEDGSYRYEYSWTNVNDLYLWQNMAAVIVSRSSSIDSYDAASEQYNYESKQYCEVQLWDVSDPAAPKLTATLGQDGSYTNSRLLDGKLYLVSGYSVWNVEEDDPETYIPHLYRDGAAELTAVGSIGFLPGGGNGFLVISAIDLAAADILSTLSVAGGGYANMYMSLNNLYLAVSVWESEAGPTRTESVYEVVEHTEHHNTRLLRISLDEGQIALAATASVPGYVIGQFALDEYNGYLRLVTTDSSYSYTTYTDTQFDFINYKYPEEQTPQTNGLYVLNDKLITVGQVSGLAPDEQVYSVRFDGDVAYFVTYEQVDPLFAVDLSQPESPVIMSALKIPGFSQYLHIWQDDSLLLGLGYATSEEGWTESLKLSMFDVSDPFDVTEAVSQQLDYNYSAALYDHHAALIDPERNLICFPADGQYLIYSYDAAAKAFKQTATVTTDDYGSQTRGLYSGQWFYVIGAGQLYVLDMQTWQVAATLTLSAGGNDGGVIIYDEKPAVEPVEEIMEDVVEEVWLEEAPVAE